MGGGGEGGKIFFLCNILTPFLRSLPSGTCRNFLLQHQKRWR
jgi:hypothetical protein